MTIRTLLGIMILLGGGVFAADQPVDASARGFFGFGGIIDDNSNLLLHVGGGGEAKIAGGLGASADLGYLFSRQSFAGGIGVFTPGLIYHFNRESRTTPFVTGGVTLLFRDGATSLAHFGGGVDHRFRERSGLRFEFRAHSRNGVFAEGRIAFLFR